MPHPTLTAAEVGKMAEQIANQRPPAVTEDQVRGTKQIVSFNVAASSRGLFLRTLSVTGELETSFLNAVVVAQLAHCFRQVGAASGWMDEDGRPQVIDPETPIQRNW